MKRLTMLLPLIGAAAFAQQPIWKNNAFAVYNDKITQGEYTAKAVSATELQSNYESPVNKNISAGITFKFSINGKDNEMASGTDHHFVCTGDACETPLIKFGQQLRSTGNTTAMLQPCAKWKVRLDMREVLAALNKDGYYTTFNGTKIYKDDFKALYIAGDRAPLIWDFDNLVNHKELELKDADGDGIYETTLTLNTPAEKKATAATWKLSKDISAFPQYTSDNTLANAIYNLGLEEMIRAVEPDSTFRTGKEWAGVWTRDISYSIILSMAHLQPRVAMNSLLRKVNKKKKIIQDTGTGGAWPCSTDRMIWAVAAWELYKVTGNKDWLQQAYTIITNSLEDDYKNAYDATTGLVKGESSFLDWREETYPRWMQPADIFESENLRTNAVHYQANIVAGKMATLLSKTGDATRYNGVAAKIKTGINQYLWQAEKKYYGQYLYGRTAKSLSPRAEALGEALTVLFDIADATRQKEIVANTPITDYGISCIYPQILGIPPYHNNAVWPFVQTYWLWACAKVGNEASVMESISAIYRPAALFVTNKENFVADNGDFAGTQINSSNMLWSLSGNLSIIHKVFFGIWFNENGLSFQPYIPKAYAGVRSLTNFKYRAAVLDISMEGFGNAIKSFTLDGKPIANASIPATLTGKHQIKIVLANNVLPAATINAVSNYTAPETPIATYEEGKLSWKATEGAVKYEVLKDGKKLQQATATALPIQAAIPTEYSIIAIDKNGVQSFASEPVMVADEKYIQTYAAEQFAPKSNKDYKGFTGDGFVEISTTENTKLDIPVTADVAGSYWIDCRYANGNGPTNTENKCAIRTLLVDGKPINAFVFPQRGKNEWSNWGFSNGLPVSLTKGKHTITIQYFPANENMNEEVNQAMIDYIRVTRIK